jgi:hypothetical protein
MRQVPAGRKVRLMARIDARNVRPTLSNDERNKAPSLVEPAGLSLANAALLAALSLLDPWIAPATVLNA